MKCVKMFLLFLVLFLSVSGQETDFELTILHYNDFHARFTEISPSDGVCNPETALCIGGIARLAALIKSCIEREPVSLVLNGGDSFQGTIWYNLLKWNVTQDFMNMLPHDAHVLGNHEFDDGISGVVPYLQHLKAPMLAANIDDDDEPTIQGLYHPSIVIEKNGRQIGIIGVIISTTNELASTGNLRFLDEVETVRNESEKLHLQGVDIIVVLSHCGYDLDREIAANAGPYIDVIVGAHSHTLLYNGDPPATSSYHPQGPYPTVVEQSDGRQVLVVQAACHTHYLGEIKIYFDEAGDALRWEGNPHYVGNEIVPDPEVLAKINEYLPSIEEQANVVIGTSLVDLTSSCGCGECNLGDLICDAFLDSVIDRREGDNWHYGHMCVINQGGIRASINRGVITVETMLLTTPFSNNVEVFEMRGDHIIEMLELSAINTPYAGAKTLQVSGIRVVFDGTRPEYDRLINATVRCIDCDVPRYEPLQANKWYRVVSQSFLGDGGDGFSMIPDNRINVQVVGVDSDVLRSYIERNSPIFQENNGRLTFNEPCIH